MEGSAIVRTRSRTPDLRRWWPLSGGNGREIPRGKTWDMVSLHTSASVGHGSVASAHGECTRHKGVKKNDGNEAAQPHEPFVVSFFWPHPPPPPPREGQ